MGAEVGHNVREEHSDGEDACHEGHVLNPDGTALRSPTSTSITQQHHRAKKKKKRMRQIRSKAYRKLMSMFSTSFGFRQPYQVLGAYEPFRQPTSLTPQRATVDSMMCETALSSKMDLAAQMQSVLVGSVKLSECAL